MFLEGFVLSGEAQKIQRVMESFARHYAKARPALPLPYQEYHMLCLSTGPIISYPDCHVLLLTLAVSHFLRVKAHASC